MQLYICVSRQLSQDLSIKSPVGNRRESESATIKIARAIYLRDADATVREGYRHLALEST
jgi:hypothetical protein